MLKSTSGTRLRMAGMMAFMFTACATLPEGTQDAPFDEQRESLTVENLLQWPFDDRHGVRAVESALRDMFELKALQSQQFSGEGPVVLKDGYVIRHVLIRRQTNSFNVGLEENPCLDPAVAAKIIDAKPNAVTKDSHGVDLGQTYRASREGISVEIGTRSVSHDCVTSIRTASSAKDSIMEKR